MIEFVKKPKLISDPPPYKRLRPGQVDDLGEAIMVLTRELWVVTDRVMALEAILEEKGVVVSEEVARYQPDEKRQAELKARCDTLIDTVARALRGMDH